LRRGVVWASAFGGSMDKPADGGFFVVWRGQENTKEKAET
jgi:hypothetical protein